MSRYFLPQREVRNSKNINMLVRTVLFVFLLYVASGTLVVLAAESGNQEGKSAANGQVTVGGSVAPVRQSLETQLALVQRDIDDLKNKLDKIESYWPIRLGKVISGWLALGIGAGIGAVAAWVNIRLIDKKKEGLVDEVLNAVFADDKTRLTRFVEEQSKENRRRILARHKKIHFVDHDDDLLSDDEKITLRRLRSFLEELGFTNLNVSLEDADLVVAVGQKVCETCADDLKRKLEGKLIPVVFFCWEKRLPPALLSSFELATPANTLPTALVHIHNLAMLTE